MKNLKVGEGGLGEGQSEERTSVLVLGTEGDRVSERFLLPDIIPNKDAGQKKGPMNCNLLSPAACSHVL